MLLAIGTRVKLKFTGEEGVVNALLGDRMVNVRLVESNMDIPVFEEDLVRTEDFWQENFSKKPVKAQYIQKDEPPAIDDSLSDPGAFIPYTILKNMGLLLAFEPVYALDGTVLHYRIYIINDTVQDLLIVATMMISGKTEFNFDISLKSASFQETGTILFDDLNRSPVVSITCKRVITSGQTESMSKDVRIKAGPFFKNVKTAPLINKKVHLLTLFETWKSTDEAKETLEDYTKRYTAKPIPEETNPFKKLRLTDINEVANFTPEIDLHIENLNSNYARMSNIEIVRTQLQHFNAFMDKAIRLGIPRVFIIHGVGEGKLKNMISNRLLQYPEVTHFKNEYHHKYGYGATEVIFK